MKVFNLVKSEGFANSSVVTVDFIVENIKMIRPVSVDSCSLYYVDDDDNEHIKLEVSAKDNLIFNAEPNFVNNTNRFYFQCTVKSSEINYYNEYGDLSKTIIDECPENVFADGSILSGHENGFYEFDINA